MLQVIALAITCFICFAFEDLTEAIIRFVLEEFALVGNLAEQVMGDQLPARGGLIPERPQRTVEQGHAGAGIIFIGLVRVVT